ncbi:MAG: hypothetical protein HC922_06375 [Leptolyngbyaceae cyanobacterium SM2_3_12]|nr:hypothetical protein [Leptolyngbyaceae cyanobacterium SM2_3_12]
MPQTYRAIGVKHNSHLQFLRILQASARSMQMMHKALAEPGENLLDQQVEISALCGMIMASISSQTPSLSSSQTASNALKNREDFNLWAEAVKQQMLEALQKRQRSQ